MMTFGVWKAALLVVLGTLPQTLQEDASWEAKERAYLERIRVLEDALADEVARREAREREWLEWTNVIASLGKPGSLPERPEFLRGEESEASGATEAVATDPDPIRIAALERAQEIAGHLRALLLAEQVLGLEFLEVGLVQGGALGPVVVRLLDDWGRPSGTLAAERVRFEGSRSGQSVTIIFEEGYQSHGGVKVPFGPVSVAGSNRGGVRRIQLPGIDPGPWLERFPELFKLEARRKSPDDGFWNLVRVRSELNALLADETRGGYWRLHSTGGVVGGVLREVHLVQLDRGGRIQGRLFADRLVILRHGDGIQLRLEDGVLERGGRRAPFLEGRYRIFLPEVNLALWESAGLPGLSKPPDAPVLEGLER